VIETKGSGERILNREASVNSCSVTTCDFTAYHGPTGERLRGEGRVGGPKGRNAEDGFALTVERTVER